MHRPLRVDLGALQLALRLGRSSRASMFHGPVRGRATATSSAASSLTNKTPVGAYRGYGQPEVELRPRAAASTAWPAGSASTRSRSAGAEHGPARTRCRGRTRPAPMYDSGDYAALPADGGRGDRLRGARARGRGRCATTGRYRRHRLGLASSSAPATPSAKFLGKRGSQFGAHESVTLRANRSGGIDALHRRVRRSGRATETAFAQVGGDGHRHRRDRGRGSRRRHPRHAAQHRRLRLAAR